MAAKPKLTPEKWAAARKVWESDPRKGFPWLIEELGLPVSAEAVRQRAKQESWAKTGEKPSLDKPKSKLGKSEKPSLEKQQKVEHPKAAPEPEWEEVDEAENSPIGRPSKYMPHFDRQAHLLCRLGATDAELAEFFRVSESTVNLWKLNYITFSESIRSAKIWADAEACNGLFKRATGFRYTEVKTKQIRPMSEDDGQGGIQAAGDELMVVEVVTTEKEALPDVSAAFIWLRNRRPKDWRDKIEVENSHKVDPALLQQLKTDMMARLEKSRERQRQILIERGLISE